MSLIGEGFGLAGLVASAGPVRAEGLIDPVISEMPPSALARDFKRGLAAHDLIELLIELFLIEQLAARGSVDLGPQVSDAVLIGVLHLGLTRDQAGENVVVEGEIGGGRG